MHSFKLEKSVTLLIKQYKSSLIALLLIWREENKKKKKNTRRLSIYGNLWMTTTIEQSNRALAVFAMQQFYGSESKHGVYIGGNAPARNWSVLSEANVCGIVTANTARPWFAMKDVRYLCLNADDEVGEDLLSRFDECIQFIDSMLERGSVLVHCSAGRSRSATVCCAYLMRRTRVGYDRALQKLRLARPYVEPNPDFARQLRYFESLVFNRDFRFNVDVIDDDIDDDIDDTKVHDEGVVGDNDVVAPSDCELCQLERRTEWLREDDPRFVVLVCDQCDYPIVVYRGAHTMQVSSDVRHAMFDALCDVADRMFGGRSQWYFDPTQRTVATHLHWHARPLDGNIIAPVWLDDYQRFLATGGSAQANDDNDGRNAFRGAQPSSSRWLDARQALVDIALPRFFDNRQPRGRWFFAHWQFTSAQSAGDETLQQKLVDALRSASPPPRFDVARVHPCWLQLSVNDAFIVIVLHVGQVDARLTSMPSKTYRHLRSLGRSKL
jgi:Dual specificity phosphatase, catalytic domain